MEMSDAAREIAMRCILVVDDDPRTRAAIVIDECLSAVEQNRRHATLAAIGRTPANVSRGRANTG